MVVADVSGKGIPASLLMARLSADVRYCLASEPSPAEAVAQLNRVFFSAGWEDRFVTLVLAVLDPLRHELTLVNAGHPPAYLQHAGKVIQAVDEANARLPLGVMDDAEYVQVSHPLDPGDQLVLYTDGISEAMNEKNELYGFQRLYEQMAVPCRGCCGPRPEHPRQRQEVRRQAIAKRRHVPGLPGTGKVMAAVEISVAFRSAKDAAFAERKATMRQLLICQS